MGIWDDPGGGFPAAMEGGPLARLLQSLMAARGAQPAMPDYIEPPGPNTRLPATSPVLPFMGARDTASAVGGDRVIPRPSGTAEGALSALLGMTGIPDIEAGAQAMGRGEYLPGFGQAAFGFGSLGALGAPVARGAMTMGREALGAVPGVLADIRGATRIPGSGNTLPETLAEKIAQLDRLRAENDAPLGGDTFFQRRLAEQQAAQPAGIRAYHGSPYDFDRFDMSKIGTGEGAQAYGHGLYFAGNEGVARSYRDALGSQGAMDALDYFLRNNRGINYKPEEIVKKLEGTRAEALASDPQAIEAIRKLLPNYMPNLPVSGGDLVHYRYLDDAAQRAIPGKMYEARINADPEHFLDWDKPLSQQSERVKQALGQFGLETGPPQFEWRMVKNPFRAEGAPEIPDRYTLFVRANDKAPWAPERAYFEKSKSGGWDLYQRGKYAGGLITDSLEGEGAKSFMRQAESMVPRTAGIGPDTTAAEAYRLLGRGQEAATSEALLRSGIPGIRYLDQGSRNTGDGTHNLVVFDDKLIDIIRKYGLAGLIAPGALAPSYMGEQ